MPPIRQAIASHKNGVDRIGCDEFAVLGLLVKGALLESVFELMNAGVIALVSGKPHTERSWVFHGFPEWREGLFRTRHACVASFGQALS